MSTRSLSGARGRSPGTAGCGIVEGAGVDVAVADGVAVLGAPSDVPVQAATNDATATITTIDRSRRRGLVRLSVPRLIRHSFAS
jgi:hypothetical protein